MRTACSMLAALLLVLAACASRAFPSPTRTEAAATATRTEAVAIPASVQTPQGPTPTATEECPCEAGKATRWVPAPTVPSVTGPLTVDGEKLRAVALAGDGPRCYGIVAQGLIRSEDGGRTWQPVSDAGLPVPAADLSALVVDPSYPERLVLGTSRGLYVSGDRGEHWQPVQAAQSLVELPISALVWDPQEKGVVYATTPQGVWRIVMASP